LILKTRSLTKTIKSELSSELTPLQNQIDYLKIKLDDQEQYSRRTNLKISGIKEQGREENTDDLVLDVINNLILKHQGVSLNYFWFSYTKMPVVVSELHLHKVYGRVIDVH
jgi:pimeloyl-CoA synthetase